MFKKVTTCKDAVQAMTNGESQQAKASKTATLMLLISLVMSGSNGIFASGVSLPSHEIVLFRAAMGAAILAVILLIAHKPLAALRYKREGLMLVLAGITMAANWLFLYEAYEFVGVSMSTILCYCAPIIVMALSPLLFRESFTAAKVIGFSIVVAGGVLVNSIALQGGAPIQGIVCGLSAACAFAAMIILNKKAEHIEGLEKTFIQVSVAAIVVIAYIVICKKPTFNVQASDALPLLALGINTAVGNFLYFKALGSLGAQSVAVLGYVEPLSSVFMSAVILGEALLPLQAAGAALIIAGALVCEIHGVPKLPKLSHLKHRRVRA